MRRTIVALAVVCISLLAVPTGAIAAGQDHHQTRCKNDGHSYIYGMTATVHGKRAKFVGAFKRFHPCGLDDGYFTGSNHKTITLTLTRASTITVFRHELAPSRTKHVTAARFPHAFRKNHDEPIYRFSGPRSAVKKLSEHFVS